MPTQPEFAAALLDPAKPLPPGLIAMGGRFDVYRNNVVASLSAALARTFPVVEQMLGDDYFRALAAEFVRRHPPGERVVARYGAAFPSFLEGFEPLREYPYLPDLARLEWARIEAWHAADHPVADLPLAEDPARLVRSQLMLHPSARIVTSDWPVASLWDAHQAEEFASPEDWQGECLAVFRREGQLVHAKLAHRHASFLEALEHSVTLGDALTSLGDETEAAVALRLAVNLLREGCIAPTANNYW